MPFDKRFRSQDYKGFFAHLLRGFSAYYILPVANSCICYTDGHVLSINSSGQSFYLTPELQSCSMSCFTSVTKCTVCVICSVCIINGWPMLLLIYACITVVTVVFPRCCKWFTEASLLVMFCIKYMERVCQCLEVRLRSIANSVTLNRPFCLTLSKGPGLTQSSSPACVNSIGLFQSEIEISP